MGSFHLGLSELPQYLSLLPDQHSALGLVVPDDNAVTAVEGRSYLASCGWHNVAVVFTDSSELWREALSLELVEEGSPKTRWLFKPCPVLEQEVAEIERHLFLQRHSPASEQVLVRAIDLGCGNGRDLVWLGSRSSEFTNSGKSYVLQWNVVGVDSRQASLNRARVLADFAGLAESRVRLLAAKVSDSSSLEQLLNMGGSERSPSLFDLVLCSRFMDRGFFQQLPLLLNPGGYVLVSSFVDGPGVQKFGRPVGHAHLLQSGELAASWFGPTQGFAVVRDDIGFTSEGRELSLFVARKLLTTAC